MNTIFDTAIASAGTTYINYCMAYLPLQVGGRPHRFPTIFHISSGSSHCLGNQSVQPRMQGETLSIPVESIPPPKSVLFGNVKLRLGEKSDVYMLELS